jgi:hypothetical protein
MTPVIAFALSLALVAFAGRQLAAAGRPSARPAVW